MSSDYFSPPLARRCASVRGPRDNGSYRQEPVRITVRDTSRDRARDTRDKSRDTSRDRSRSREASKENLKEPSIMYYGLQRRRSLPRSPKKAPPCSLSLTPATDRRPRLSPAPPAPLPEDLLTLDGDQFDQFLYHSHHVATTPTLNTAPEFVLEVPSDSESSRRPSHSSVTNSEYSAPLYSPLPSPVASPRLALLPQPRLQRRASSHETGPSKSRQCLGRRGSGALEEGGLPGGLLAVPQQRSRGASLPGGTLGADDLYRLRNFSRHGKKVINKGDSFKNKSRSSLCSSARSSMDFINSSPGSDYRSRQSSLRSRASSFRTSRHSKSSLGDSPSARSSPRSCEAVEKDDSELPPVEVVSVLLLGAPGVGKSSLCAQFLSSEHINAYDKVEDAISKEVSVAVDGAETRIHFVDHQHGEMSVENQLGTYSPDVILVVLAVDDWGSVDQAERVLTYLRVVGVIAKSPVILVANKADLVRNRQVKAAAGKSLAQKFNIKYIETSPGINHNVDELLVGILTQLRLKRQKAEQEKSAKRQVMDFLGKFIKLDMGKSCSNLNIL